MSLFRRRGRLPQLRSYTTHKRRDSHQSTGRAERFPQLTSYAANRRSSQRNLAWTLISLAVLGLTLVVASPLWLPVLSKIVPDRYIMAYAPEPLQQVIFEIDVSEQIPTPEAVDQSAAAALLEDIGGPTAVPVQGVSPSTSGNPGGYVQPTAFALAPTPTVTPAVAMAVDERAEDRENQADLSHVSNLLTGFTFAQQGYNNCGPASISTLMSYWDVEFTQNQAAAVLKPNPEDPNVRPDELADFVEGYGYQVVIRENGNFDVIKDFILAGYPVLIETGYDPEPETVGWTSHYLTIVGFSDEDDGFIAMDTYRRPNWVYPYDEIDHFWRQFNRRYLIVHRPDQAVAVASIIGENMDDATMWEGALYTAQLELQLDRSDPYGWYNLGASLNGLGRYEEAATAFDQARELGLPWRFLWYQFAPFEAYLQVGRTSDVIALADSVLAKKATEEAFYYKGLALAAEGDIANARSQLNYALKFNENFEAAQMALTALES